MNEVIAFTANFLKLHPRNAANALESLPVEDTVELLKELPPDLAAKTLEVLAPQYAAQCFLKFPPEKCTEFLHSMKAYKGISLFRFIPNSMSKLILKELVPAKKALIKKKLSYPQNLVGAWMDSEIPAVTETTLVEQIRKTFRLAQKEIDYAPCVVDSHGTVIGTLHITKLIATKDSSPVSKIMERDFITLSDRATIRSVAPSPYWDRFEALPVVDGKSRFVGMLTLNNLNRAMAVSGDKTDSEQIDSVFMDGINAYISALKWLVGSATGASPDDSTTSKESRHDR